MADVAMITQAWNQRILQGLAMCLSIQSDQGGWVVSWKAFHPWKADACWETLEFCGNDARILWDYSQEMGMGVQIN